MKLLHDEKAGNGKDRFVFHVGSEELVILDALINNALRYIPKKLTHETVRNRLRQMNREMVKAKPHLKSNIEL